MTNAELITALRRCSYMTVADVDREDGYCKPCAYYTEDSADVTCMDRMMIDAADALEAAEQKIAELSAQIPKRGECEAKKPKTVKETEYSFYCDCPNCGGRLISNVDGEWCAGSFDRFCRMCGQKIDWSEYCVRLNMPRGARMKGEQE